MWVVKLGGSLCSDPVLPQWLELLAQLGGGAGHAGVRWRQLCR